MYGAASPASHPSPQSPYPTPPYSDGIDPSYVHAQRSIPPLTYFPLHPYMSLEPNSVGGQPSGSLAAPFQIPRRQPLLGYLGHNERPQDTVHQIGNHLITASSKLTPALVGERFAEPTLVDHQGRKALIFVFGVSGSGEFVWDFRLPFSIRAFSSLAAGLAITSV